MTKMMLAAFAALSLGASAAYAQGVPAGTVPPAYGSTAFSDHRNDQVVHFLGKDTTFGRLFGHSDSGQGVAGGTATTSTKGG